MMSTHSKPQLTFFKCRGIAQFQQVLLAYFNIDYEMNYVEKIDDDLRKCLKFGTLPLLREVDGFSLNQSSAISHWYAEHNNFLGTNMKERSLVVEALTCVHTDIVLPAVRAAQGKGDREHIINEVIPRYFGAFEKILRENKHIAMGDNYTLADMHVYVAYDYLGHLGYAPEHMQGKFPKLDELKHYFESNKGVHEYLKNRPDDYEMFKSMHSQPEKQHQPQLPQK